MAQAAAGACGRPFAMFASCCPSATLLASRSLAAAPRTSMAHGTERLMLADCGHIRDDWHDYLPALRSVGVSVTEMLAKVAHLLSWCQRNEAIAERMALNVSKVKVLVHDVLVLLEVDNRDAAAVVIRHAVEKWRADRNRRPPDRRARPPVATPRRPGAVSEQDQCDRRPANPNG